MSPALALKPTSGTGLPPERQMTCTLAADSLAETYWQQTDWQSTKNIRFAISISAERNQDRHKGRQLARRQEHWQAASWHTGQCLQWQQTK